MGHSNYIRPNIPGQHPSTDCAFDDAQFGFDDTSPNDLGDPFPEQYFGVPAAEASQLWIQQTRGSNGPTSAPIQYSEPVAAYGSATTYPQNPFPDQPYCEPQFRQDSISNHFHSGHASGNLANQTQQQNAAYYHQAPSNNRWQNFNAYSQSNVAPGQTLPAVLHDNLMRDQHQLQYRATQQLVEPTPQIQQHYTPSGLSYRPVENAQPSNQETQHRGRTGSSVTGCVRPAALNAVRTSNGVDNSSGFTMPTVELQFESAKAAEEHIEKNFTKVKMLKPEGEDPKLSETELNSYLDQLWNAIGMESLKVPDQLKKEDRQYFLRQTRRQHDMIKQQVRDNSELCWAHVVRTFWTAVELPSSGVKLAKTRKLVRNSNGSVTDKCEFKHLPFDKTLSTRKRLEAMIEAAKNDKYVGNDLIRGLACPDLVLNPKLYQEKKGNTIKGNACKARARDSEADTATGGAVGADQGATQRRTGQKMKRERDEEEGDVQLPPTQRPRI